MALQTSSGQYPLLSPPAHVPEATSLNILTTEIFFLKSLRGFPIPSWIKIFRLFIMNIPLLPPTLFWFPARDWFTPHWESHSNVLPYLSHLFLPLRQVKCSPHCLEGPLSSFYQLNSAEGLSSLKPPSDYPIYSPSLYPCPLERIPLHMFIPTLLDVFCAFSCIWYVWDPGRDAPKQKQKPLFFEAHRSFHEEKSQV